MGEVSLLIAFSAGILSFLSPCVLPIIPGYISYISGVGAQETKENAGFSWRVFTASLLFVIGFSIVFTLMGGHRHRNWRITQRISNLYSQSGW